MEIPFNCSNKMSNRKYQSKSIKIKIILLKMMDNNNTLNQIPNPVFTCKMSNLRSSIKDRRNKINRILISMVKSNHIKLSLLLNPTNISHKSRKYIFQHKSKLQCIVKSICKSILNPLRIKLMKVEQANHQEKTFT